MSCSTCGKSASKADVRFARVLIDMLELPPANPAVWSLNEALNFIRELQPRALTAGYCLSLGGGVLNHGFSRRNLDIFACPLTTKARREDLMQLLPPVLGVKSTSVTDTYTLHVNIPERSEVHPLELVFQKYPA